MDMIPIDMQKRRLFRQKSETIAENLMPWIDSSERFIDRCTQCKQCLTQCPEHIIVMSSGGFPIIDFSLGECTFCGQCAEQCHEQIFNETNQLPWQKKAVIDDRCLANEQVYCRSCGESCLEEALSFQVGITAVPTINLSACNGCGACVAPCPTHAIAIKDVE